jgi:hypothetical protein
MSTRNGEARPFNTLAFISCDWVVCSLFALCRPLDCPSYCPTPPTLHSGNLGRARPEVKEAAAEGVRAWKQSDAYHKLTEWSASSADRDADPVPSEVEAALYHAGSKRIVPVKPRMSWADLNSVGTSELQWAAAKAYAAKLMGSGEDPDADKATAEADKETLPKPSDDGKRTRQAARVASGEDEGGSDGGGAEDEERREGGRGGRGGGRGGRGGGRRKGSLGAKKRRGDS